MSDYDDASGFMSDFYGEQPAQKTFPGGEPTYTTMAIGEEDGGGLIEPDPPRPPNPFLDLEPPMATTMAMGEEDAPFAEPTIEEIADRLGWVDSPTTMAVGEEDGGMPDTPGVDLMRPVPDAPVFSLPPGVDPMFPAPVTPSPVNPVFTPAPPPPVVNPVFTPSPDNTAFTPPPPPPVEGRTYGAYSGTPMGPTNSIQPFTPYMAPQQAQGPDLQSLITDTDYFLNNSAPRTSVFKRS